MVEIGAAVEDDHAGRSGARLVYHVGGGCRYCKEGHYGLCTGGGGWIFGHLIDGLQAEYARVPFADSVRVQGAGWVE